MSEATFFVALLRSYGNISIFHQFIDVRAIFWFLNRFVRRLRCFPVVELHFWPNIILPSQMYTTFQYIKKCRIQYFFIILKIRRPFMC